MKKIYLLIFSLIGISEFNAQTTLTKAANEPIVGDTYDTRTLDSNATAMPMGTSGSSVTWNLTNLVSGALVTNSYLSPSTSTNSASFPGSTILLNDGTNTSYFKSTASSYELLGAEISFSGLTAVLNYSTNSAVIAQYPMAMGYTNTDAVGGTISAASFSGPFSGTITTNGDATGTLNLNGTALSSCLRLKTKQNVSFTLAFGSITGTVDQTIYNYFNSSSKWPLFSVSYTHIVTSGAQTTDQMQTQISSLSSIPLGIRENKLNDIIFKAYPNPANNEVNIHFVLTQNESYTIEIVNTLGQVVKAVSKPNLQPGMYNETLDISGLTAGVYHINVSGKNAKGVEKLIIQ